ncbi:13533_t:CDS:2, partial [Dentiscutata erythropus]
AVLSVASCELPSHRTSQNVKYSNEEALKQASLDTLILTFHVDIEPEFQFCSQSNHSCGKAIDLVKASSGKIEFNNIRMECIKLGEVQVSLSLVVKSEDEILSLEINDPYQPNQKHFRETFWNARLKR